MNRCQKCDLESESVTECEVCGTFWCPDCFEHHAITELEQAVDGQYEAEDEIEQHKEPERG